MSQTNPIEIPAKRYLAPYECPDCGERCVALTRYKVGSVDPTKDDAVNDAMPGGACPECGSEENWPLQEEPEYIADELWKHAISHDLSLAEIWERASG